MQTITSNNLEVIRMTKGKLPRLPFALLKEKILGKKYSLNIVFATPLYITNLNKDHRKKSYTPNVLAFPIDEKSGEIYMSLSVVRKEAHTYDYSYENAISYLLIHAMLHLKGYDHSSTMDDEERKLEKYFKLSKLSK